jgi:rod shape determining protein RodA
LLYLLIFGQVSNGIKGWIYISNLSIQPSEFAKISLIIILSHILNEFHFKEKTNTKEELILICKVFLITLIPAVLTFLEPDTGSTITYFFIAFIMLFISGLKKKWFIIFFVLISFFILSFYILYTKFSNVFIDMFSSNFYYRIQRLINWSNSSGMQLENSMIAIGISEIKGYGFGNTPIYVPEPYSDFIFSIYANNTGIIGIISFLLLTIVFDLLIIKIATISSKTIDKYLIGGIIACLIFNQIQNLSMTIGLLPITGITLPFISYGGSSLIVYFIMIGLSINALNVKNV